MPPTAEQDPRVEAWQEAAQSSPMAPPAGFLAQRLPHSLGLREQEGQRSQAGQCRGPGNGGL